MAPLGSEGTFTPPSFEGTLVVPSNIGGAHWGGLAYDPERQIAVVPVNRVAAVAQLVPRERHDRASVERGWEYAPVHGTPYVIRRRILLSPLGLPCTPPPFGELVAISLATGQKLWEVPLGDHARSLRLENPDPAGVPLGHSEFRRPHRHPGRPRLHRRRDGRLPPSLRRRDRPRALERLLASRAGRRPR
jgi:glucose dehydrogenase